MEDVPKTLKDLFIEELIEGGDIQLDEMMQKYAKDTLTKAGKTKVIKQLGNGWEMVIENVKFDVTKEEILEKIKESRRRQRKKAKRERKEAKAKAKKEAAAKQKKAAVETDDHKVPDNVELVDVDDMPKEFGESLDKQVLDDFESDADDEYVPEPEDRKFIKGKLQCLSKIFP